MISSSLVRKPPAVLSKETYSFQNQTTRQRLHLNLIPLQNDFLHSVERIPFDLNRDEVKFRIPSKCRDSLPCTISLDLFNGLVPLFPGSLLCRVRFEIFQLDDVGVGGRSAAVEVRHHEEVAVAVTEFHLRIREVVGVEAEIGCHESLYVSLSFNQAADGGRVMVLPTDVFHHRAPVTVKGCRLEMAVQFGDIDVLYFRIFDDEVFVELFAHIVVRNAEYGVHPVSPSDCEQAVVVEQALEHVRFNQSVRRERRLHLTESEAVLRHLKNDALAVSVEFVEADELVELVVVGGSVAVEHLFGSLAMIDVIAEIVADHVGVVHLRICFNRPPAETVPVIPRLHLGNQSVLVGLQRPHALIVPNHLPHLRLAESEHHVEVRVEGERGRDVVAAGDVVHRDWAYSHH